MYTKTTLVYSMQSARKPASLFFSLELGWYGFAHVRNVKIVADELYYVYSTRGASARETSTTTPAFACACSTQALSTPLVARLSK